jgi:hypothetical protein
MELFRKGWIRSESDSDSTYAPARLKLLNWKATIEEGTYYNDSNWFKHPWKRFVSEIMPLR